MAARDLPRMVHIVREPARLAYHLRAVVVAHTSSTQPSFVWNQGLEASSAIWSASLLQDSDVAEAMVGSANVVSKNATGRILLGAHSVHGDLLWLLHLGHLVARCQQRLNN